MVSSPKAPDPYETAVTQSSMNGDTAIRQHLLNMVNQNTPDGSLTYSQTGQTFTPSKTGDQYWYNKKTGEYSTNDPFAKTRTVTTDPTTTKGFDWRTGRNSPSGTGGSAAGIVNSERGKVTTKGADEWSQVQGLLTPGFTATTTLSPENQKIYDETMKSKLNLSKTAAEQTDFLRKYLGKPIDTSGAPGQWSYLGKNYQTKVGDEYTTSYAGADDFSADRQKYEDALMARQQPAMKQTQDRVRQQLIASGIRPGTAAWDSEQARLSAAETDTRMASILGAGDEQARMVGMARDAAQFGNTSSLARMGAENDALLTKANFQNNSRKDWLNEAYTQRNQPLQEISSLLSGSQIQNPNFVNTPQTNVGGVDYAGLVGDKYKADSQAYGAGMGGLFGLLSAPFSMFKASDRRLKKDIKCIGAAHNGLPWYEFRYHDDPADAPVRYGLMSDDVRKVKPDAIMVDERGFDLVNYDAALEVA